MSGKTAPTQATMIEVGSNYMPSVSWLSGYALMECGKSVDLAKSPMATMLSFAISPARNSKRYRHAFMPLNMERMACSPGLASYPGYCIRC